MSKEREKEDIANRRSFLAALNAKSSEIWIELAPLWTKGTDEILRGLDFGAFAF